MNYFNKSISKICNFLTLKKQGVHYDDYPDIRGMIYIHNKGTASFGDHLKINNGPFPNPVGGNGKTILFIEFKAILQIGSHVGISNAEIVVKQKVTIGNRVMIGGGTRIYDSDFHPIDYKKRIETPNAGLCAPIEIRDDAFIGAYSTILKGVTIGRGAVIGAGSVVTKDVPDYEIWAGNPARFIRKV